MSVYIQTRCEKFIQRLQALLDQDAYYVGAEKFCLSASEQRLARFCVETVRTHLLNVRRSKQKVELSSATGIGRNERGRLGNR